MLYLGLMPHTSAWFVKRGMDGKNLDLLSTRTRPVFYNLGGQHYCFHFIGDNVKPRVLKVTSQVYMVNEWQI